MLPSLVLSYWKMRICIFQEICILLSRDHAVCLGTIWMPIFLYDSCSILIYTDDLNVLTLYLLLCLSVWMLFNVPVINYMVMSRRLVNQSAFFLNRVNHYVVHILSSGTDKCPTWINGRESTAVKNDFMTNLLEIIMPNRKIDPTTSWIPVGRASNHDTCTGPGLYTTISYVSF